MKSAIEKLILEGKGQLEFIPRSSETVAQGEKIAACEEKIKNLTAKNPELREAVEEFQKAIEDSVWFEVLTHYRAGFRNGFFLAADLYGAE